MARLLLADDHVIIREGLKKVLGTSSDFQVVGEVEDGHSLKEVVKTLQPDVLLCEWKISGPSIFDQSCDLKILCPKMKIIIFTSFEDPHVLQRTIEVGIEGYIKKDSHPEQVLDAIRMVLKGYTCYPSRPHLLKKNDSHIKFTDREWEVFQLIIENLSNHEISNRLCISEATVKTHVSSILRKTGQPNRSQAVLYAIKEGLVPIVHAR